jgi:hypothetical protein
VFIGLAPEETLRILKLVKNQKLAPAAAKGEAEASRAKFRIISRTLYHANIIKGWASGHKNHLAVTSLKTVAGMENEYYVKMPQLFPKFDPAAFLEEHISIALEPKYAKKQAQASCILPSHVISKLRRLLGTYPPCVLM